MRPILLYVSLVGLPVLGILGLLQVGQTLSAPISLAGKWNAQLIPRNPQDLAGNNSLLRPGPTTLNITQSGPNLLLSFEDDPKATFVGNIRDMTINAGMVRQDAKATYTSNGTTSIFLRARVDRHTSPERLLGVLTFANESVRIEVPLTAIRQSGVGNLRGE